LDPQTPPFDGYYQRRAGELVRFAAAIVGRRDAEDICQEAWTRIWKAWGQADPDRLDAWTYRIVRNACIDHLRLHRRPTVPLDAVAAVLPGTSSADGPVFERAEADAALALMATLPAPLRETIWLREVAELSYAEIAGVLDVPIGTVMSRLHSGRRKLARRLRKTPQ
jgi:RNA polymerase sigma-70 factor (ECF subfamily)